MQFLTPDMIGRIATAFELDRNKTQPAVSSAVPALLAAFNDTATQPGGAQKLADAAGQQASTLRNFASALAAGGQSSLYEDGSRRLLSLVGAQKQNALTEAIANMYGTKSGRNRFAAWNTGPDYNGYHRPASGNAGPRSKRH